MIITPKRPVDNDFLPTYPRFVEIYNILIQKHDATVVFTTREAPGDPTIGNVVRIAAIFDNTPGIRLDWFVDNFAVSVPTVLQDFPDAIHVASISTGV